MHHLAYFQHPPLWPPPEAELARESEDRGELNPATVLRETPGSEPAE